MVRRRMIVALLALILSACGSRGNMTRGNSNELLRDEIAAAPVGDLLQAVERLRPRWLQARGPRSLNGQSNIVVFLNRTYVGGPETLNQFDVRNVVRLRYLDAAQANATLNLPAGMVVGAAIVVEMSAGG